MLVEAIVIIIIVIIHSHLAGYKAWYEGHQSATVIFGYIKGSTPKFSPCDY